MCPGAVYKADFRSREAILHVCTYHSMYVWYAEKGQAEALHYFDRNVFSDVATRLDTLTD